VASFFHNGGQWYYQNDKGIWKVSEGEGKRFSLVVTPFTKFKEAHGGGKESSKKSTKD